jgi:hypothetical protein
MILRYFVPLGVVHALAFFKTFNETLRDIGEAEDSNLFTCRALDRIRILVKCYTNAASLVSAQCNEYRT